MWKVCKNRTGVAPSLLLLQQLRVQILVHPVSISSYKLTLSTRTFSTSVSKQKQQPQVSSPNIPSSTSSSSSSSSSTIQFVSLKDKDITRIIADTNVGRNFGRVASLFLIVHGILTVVCSLWLLFYPFQEEMEIQQLRQIYFNRELKMSGILDQTTTEGESPLDQMTTEEKNELKRRVEDLVSANMNTKWFSRKVGAAGIVTSFVFGVFSMNYLTRRYVRRIVFHCKANAPQRPTHMSIHLQTLHPFVDTREHIINSFTLLHVRPSAVKPFVGFKPTFSNGKSNIVYYYARDADDAMHVFNQLKNSMLGTE
jgi:hypothetical protein